jgi:hypothetical protein
MIIWGFFSMPAMTATVGNATGAAGPSGAGDGDGVGRDRSDGVVRIRVGGVARVGHVGGVVGRVGHRRAPGRQVVAGAPVSA